MEEYGVLKIKKSSLVDAVIRRMLDYAKRGVFTRGGKIPGENELAKEFNVSRTTLREAYKRLEAAGFLVSKQGDGTYLCDMKDPDLDDVISLFEGESQSEKTLYSASAKQRISDAFSAFDYHLVYYVEAREAIEMAVVEYIIQRATPDDFQRLKMNLEAQKSFLDNKEMFSQLDCMFHQLFYSASKNLFFMQFWSLLQPSMEEQSRRALNTPGVSESMYSCHEKIYEALMNSDVQRAKLLVSEHIRIVPGRVLFGSFE